LTFEADVQQGSELILQESRLWSFVAFLCLRWEQMEEAWQPHPQHSGWDCDVHC
jgi:hypothetical protein